MTEIPSTKQKFDLEERTLTFAKQVIRLCKTLPRDTISRELVGQLVRASGSVGANYREANEALSRKDFSLRVRIARKEAKETHYWLQLLREAHPTLNNGEMGSLLQESIELRKILSSIANKL